MVDEKEYVGDIKEDFPGWMNADPKNPMGGAGIEGVTKAGAATA